jgi:hypothetical protein
MIQGNPLYLRKAKVEVFGRRKKTIENLRIAFEVEKDLSKADNRATIRIFNLSEDSRNTFRERYSKVRLSCAYHDNDFTELFFGDITNVYHRRERADWISEMYCISGSKFTKESLAAIAESRSRRLIDAIKFVAGYFKDENGESPRIGEIRLADPDIIVGPIYGGGKVSDAMNRLADSYNFNWFFDGDTFFAATDGELLQSFRTITLSPTTGLLDAPTVTLSGIQAKSLLIADLLPGCKVVINSAAKRFNFGNLNLDNVTKTYGEGAFELRRLEHIGDTRSKEWYTEFEAFRINQVNQ